MAVANSCEGARRERIVQACQNVSQISFYLLSVVTTVLKEKGVSNLL